MKAGRILRVLMPVLIGLAFSAHGQAEDAPRLPGLGGDSFSESDLARGTTVVVLWASWSPKCRAVPAQIATLESSLGGVRIVSVSYQEDEAAAAAFARQGALRGAIYLDRDGAFARRVGLATLPAFIVYRDGAVLLRGRLGDESASQISAALRR